VTENADKTKANEELIAALKKEAADAHAEVEKTKKEIQAAHAREMKAKKEATSKEEKQTSTLTPPPEPASVHGHEEGKPHYIGAWQKFYPTCGDPNPDFKDETECADCHTHLGAKEVAEKLKACPNCGGHNAKRL